VASGLLNIGLPFSGGIALVPTISSNSSSNPHVKVLANYY
jgi:hypothetical protein